MIKKLAKAIREYKKESILAPLFVSMEVVLEVVIPLFMAKLIDDGIYNGNMSMVYKIGVELIIFALLSLFQEVLRVLLSAWVWNRSSILSEGPNRPLHPRQIQCVCISGRNNGEVTDLYLSSLSGSR